MKKEYKITIKLPSNPSVFIEDADDEHIDWDDAQALFKKQKIKVKELTGQAASSLDAYLTDDCLEYVNEDELPFVKKGVSAVDCTMGEVRQSDFKKGIEFEVKLEVNWKKKPSSDQEDALIKWLMSDIVINSNVGEGLKFCWRDEVWSWDVASESGTDTAAGTFGQNNPDIEFIFMSNGSVEWIVKYQLNTEGSSGKWLMRDGTGDFRDGNWFDCENKAWLKNLYKGLDYSDKPMNKFIAKKPKK